MQDIRKLAGLSPRGNVGGTGDAGLTRTAHLGGAGAARGRRRDSPNLRMTLLATKVLVLPPVAVRPRAGPSWLTLVVLVPRGNTDGKSTSGTLAVPCSLAVVR